MRISVVGNINIDLNAVIGDSVNSEENRIKKLGLSSGGSAANTAIILSRLGREVFLQGAVGDDLFGDYLIERLSRERVETGYIKVLSGGTGLCFAAIGEQGQRHLYTYRGANERYETVAGGFDFYHFAGIATGQLSVMLNSLNIERFSYNPGGIVTFERPREVSKLAERAEVLFLNETEWAFLSPFLNRTNTVVVTMGAAGSRIESGPSVEALPVEVVDTTGAGDAFNAGFLHAYLSGRQGSDCLKVGNLLGAIVAMHVGATPEFEYGYILEKSELYKVKL
ncbi:MAG TPA: carbohydrate kinase family protein [Mesotoga sp.]|nr:carbohydrate kinase family protein [Mesotoga sp.]MDI9375766.1 carbohydrate kinase family protein [Thermotogota bacterium]NLX34192.1 carbohydrate kinase family protein [Thermotogaceae bacterium]MDD4040539.1 carbohydrate kinase family protein [Mesotoga sp.]MDD4477837.1 carbohydrate kinase family protein [Mesotoga sp.]